MAVGQVGFAEALNVPALNAVCERLEARELARGRLHAELLTDALVLDRVLADAGMSVSTASDLALRLRASEHRAAVLLEQARTLSGLPDGLAALAEGLLTVEQAGVFVVETARLTGAALVAVWQRLIAELRAGLASGRMLTPGRLSTLLRRWVLEAAPADAVVRRKQAEAEGRVEVRRRDDGLADLFALGITGPNAQACLSAIQVASAPVGLGDERSADKRRLDALVDLLTGRCVLPLGDEDGQEGERDPFVAGGSCRARGVCGCPVGANVPCGADTQVLVPLGAALGTTDELAELVGHGVLDPDLLRRLLMAAPRLRAVWVDEAGVPVATGDRTLQPRRGDPADLRAQLVALAAMPFSRLEPRCPDDHPRGEGQPGTAAACADADVQAGADAEAHVADDRGAVLDLAGLLEQLLALVEQPVTTGSADRTGPEQAARQLPDVDAPPSPRLGAPADTAGACGSDSSGSDGLPVEPAQPAPDDMPASGPAADPAGRAAASDAHPGAGRAGLGIAEEWLLTAVRAVASRATGRHPLGAPGAYRGPAKLRRLLTVRRPLCEWPGCGIRARRCDLDHDLAWPQGPTCGCNVGPLCRRHHRVKQTGWTKSRTAAGVTWTGPTGRSWESPTPHQPPVRPLRALPQLPVTGSDPLDLLGDLEREAELWHSDPTASTWDGAEPSTRCDDKEPNDDTDRQQWRLWWGDTTWTLSIAEAQAWQDIPHPSDR